MTFAETINRGLQARGWTPTILAGQLAQAGHNYTVQTIERWLDGSNEPRVTTGLAALDALDVPRTVVETHRSGAKAKNKPPDLTAGEFNRGE